MSCGQTKNAPTASISSPSSPSASSSSTSTSTSSFFAPAVSALRRFSLTSSHENGGPSSLLTGILAPFSKNKCTSEPEEAPFDNDAILSNIEGLTLCPPQTQPNSISFPMTTATPSSTATTTTTSSTNSTSGSIGNSEALKVQETSGSSSPSAYEQAQLLLVCLLENFCLLYDRNPKRNKKLFRTLCHELWKMGILSSEDFFTHSERLNNSYRGAFRSLFLQAITNSEDGGEDGGAAVEEDISGEDGDIDDVDGEFFRYQDTNANTKIFPYERMMMISSPPPSPSPSPIPSPSSSPINNSTIINQTFYSPTASEHSASSISLGRLNSPFYPYDNPFPASSSRLHTEFKSMEPIGRGGFAHVFKAEHRLDSCLYAFKMIKFRSRSSDIFTKILRECQSLARLDHPNIVRYHVAWIESGTSFPWDKDDHHHGHRNSTNISSNDSIELLPPLIASAPVTQTSIKGIEIPNNLFSFDHCDKKGIGGAGAGAGAGAKRIRGKGKSFYDDEEEEDPKYSMIIQMELCQFTLADWIEQRNHLIFNNSPSPKRQSVPNEQMAIKIGDSLKWEVNARENCKIFKSIVKGLVYIHNRGIIHRDLKPGNILFHSDGAGSAGANSHFPLNPSGILEEYTAKIGDFGLAARGRISQSHAENPYDSSNTINTFPSPPSTDSDSMMTSGLGTITYAAPEQMLNDMYDEKVDIYSLGIILFELFHPIKTRMERITIFEDLKRGFIPPELLRNWPKEATFIWSCISPNPKNRPSAQQILESEIFEADPEETIEHLSWENMSLKMQLEKERERYRLLEERVK